MYNLNGWRVIILIKELIDWHYCLNGLLGCQLLRCIHINSGYDTSNCLILNCIVTHVHNALIHIQATHDKIFLSVFAEAYKMPITAYKI